MQKTQIPLSLWADWPFFLAAHRAGSLTAAARELGVEQSTVSRRITRLESALGHELFQRTPEGLLATEVAIALLPDVERSERAVAEAFNVATGADLGAAGRVRIAAPESMAVGLLAPALPRLQRDHPEVQITFVTGMRLVDLTRREADVGVRIVAPTAPELVGRRVARYGTGVFATHALAKQLAETPPARWPWIGVDSDHDGFAEGAWHRKHVPESAVASDSYLTRFAACRAGAGCALLPRPWAIRDATLVELAAGPPVGPPCPIYLVTHRALRRVPRIEAVWSWLAEVCGEADEAALPSAPS